MTSLIEVKDLETNFYTDAGVVRAVNGVDFTIEREKTLGVVGESGCGKSVTALDVSIQAQVINLLQDLQEQFGLAYLFIAHDLSVIKYISDRVAVMYLGKIVELAATKELFLNPKHPYTEALMSAVPVPDPRYKVDQILLEGDVPSPLNPPSGCYFHPRCNYSEDICKTDVPEYRDIADEHFAACHFADTLSLRSIQE